MPSRRRQVALWSQPPPSPSLSFLSCFFFFVDPRDYSGNLSTGFCLYFVYFYRRRSSSFSHGKNAYAIKLWIKFLCLRRSMEPCQVLRESTRTTTQQTLTDCVGDKGHAISPQSPRIRILHRRILLQLSLGRSSSLPAQHRLYRFPDLQKSTF